MLPWMLCCDSFQRSPRSWDLALMLAVRMPGARCFLSLRDWAQCLPLVSQCMLHSMPGVSCLLPTIATVVFVPYGLRESYQRAPYQAVLGPRVCLVLREATVPWAVCHPYLVRPVGPAASDWLCRSCVGPVRTRRHPHRRVRLAPSARTSPPEGRRCALHALSECTALPLVPRPALSLYRRRLYFVRRE